MMGEIYRASGCVDVWLGREFHNYLDSTEVMLQGVWRLEQAREGDSLSADSLEQLVNDPFAKFQQIGDSSIKRAAREWLNTLDLDTIKEWLDMPHLFHRTWFTRAWILQEVLMARDLTIVCGRYIVPWDMFLLMSSIVECCRLLRGTFDSEIFEFPLWEFWVNTSLTGAASMLCKRPQQDHVSPLRLAQWRTKYQREGRLSMVSALSLSRNQQATDARDKVFCILAFSPIERKDDHSIQPIRPDYSVSSIWLYIEVAKSLVALYGPCILSLSGLRSRSTTIELPTWVPDLNSQLTSRLRGFNALELHPTTSVTSCIGRVARGSPSNVHVTSQNELVIRCHLWDVIAETAHSGLNEVGRNLEGLAQWMEILSKLDASPEQRRQALLCSLVERPSNDLSNESHFEDWLQFLCFNCTVGQWQNVWQESGLPYDCDIQMREQLTQGQEPMETLISRAQEHFAKLGHALSSDTIKNWSGEGIKDSANLYHKWYWDMTKHATQYGNMLRDNDPTRRLLRTALTNMLGTGPKDAQPGDLIVLIEGVYVPYLVRGVREGKFKLLGEIYVHDLDVEKILEDTDNKKRIRDLYII